MEIQAAFLEWRDAITPAQHAVASKYWGFDDIKSAEELKDLLTK
jgi:hypothetical protein